MKKTLNVIGLMSGTSFDGVDCVLCKINPDLSFDVLKSDIKYLFSKLNSQEIRVISLRYGFELYNGKSGLTLLEIGKIMNLSGERIRIIEKNAMKKMKLTVENKEKGKKLINYLRS